DGRAIVIVPPGDPLPDTAYQTAVEFEPTMIHVPLIAVSPVAPDTVIGEPMTAQEGDAEKFSVTMPPLCVAEVTDGDDRSSAPFPTKYPVSKTPPFWVISKASEHALGEERL